jgi:hypothetical protein
MMNPIVKYKYSPWQNIMKLEIHENCVEFHDVLLTVLTSWELIYTLFALDLSSKKVSMG